MVKPNENEAINGDTNGTVIHLILQGKGGVGKSVVATWLAEYLLKQRSAFEVVEAAEQILRNSGATILTEFYRFGDISYAKEELRAELASVFLAAERGIPHDPEQHAAYVSSWINEWRADHFRSNHPQGIM